MKAIPVTVFASICFLLVLGRGQDQFNRFSRGPVQEERQEEQYMKEEQTNEIYITHIVKSKAEEEIADIKWLKKAAAKVIERGASYFNVLDQSSSQRFVKEKGRNMTVIEGVVRIENDPMYSQYDAHEINKLVVDDSGAL